MHKRLFNIVRLKKSTFLILLSVVFLVSVFAVTFSNITKASAATTAASKSTDADWQVKSWWFYNAVTQCMDSVGSWNISKSADVKSGNWFYTGPTIGNVGDAPAGWYMQDYLGMGEDGQINCNENSNKLTKAALGFWGLNGTEVMCGADILVRSNGTNCEDGNGDFTWKVSGDDKKASKFASYIKKTIFSNQDPSLTKAQKYVLYKQTLFNACMAPSPKVYTSDPGGANVYKIAVVDSSSDTSTIKHNYFIGNQSENFNVWVSTNPNKQQTCKWLADQIDDTGSDSLAAAAKAASDRGDTAGPASDGVSCADDATCTDTTTSCSVEGIGWILCPVANAIAGLTDAMFEGVKAFMIVAPLGLSTQDNPLYTAWSVMRSVANVAFVIVFLIIIFSQLTSAGVSNYGVKKLLPRLIVGAILVNLSYFICAVAVDASNILGVGIQQVFNGITSQAANTGDNGDNWASITTTVLSGVGTIALGVIAIEALTAGGIWAALAALLPLLVGALFALVIAFLVLLARQALIIMLIVLAPLAFVAYLLPNTEDLYKKWQKLFTTLLLLFPMLSVVFGASLLASSILRNTALTTPGVNPFVGFCLYIGSFAVQAIPFFITPLLINLSQGVLSRFAGLVNNKNKGPFDRLRKGGERIAKDAQNRGNARKLNDANRNSAFSFGARRRANRERVTSSLEGIARNNATDTVVSQLEQRGPNGGPSSLAMRMAGGRDNEEQAGIIANKAVAAAEAEELKEALQPLLREISRKSPADKETYLKQEVDAGGARASAALHYSAQIGDSATMRDHLANGTEEVKQKAQEAINANANAFLAKAPDLVKGPGAAFGSVKGGELVNFKPDTAKAYIDHIRSLSQKAQGLKSSSPGSAAHLDAEKKYQTAVNGFNSAVEDITKSVDLQGQFSGELGIKLRDEITSAELHNEPLGTDMNKGAAGIQDDGKIR